MSYVLCNLCYWYGATESPSIALPCSVSPLMPLCAIYAWCCAAKATGQDKQPRRLASNEDVVAIADALVEAYPRVCALGVLKFLFAFQCCIMCVCV